jgi:GH25 family lysozyme M1 (1,4-beta-N-acetylmuramidase)
MILIADMNHANPVNFAKMAAAGIGGVIHKVDQGLGFADPLYAARRVLAEAAGLEWGGYDFATDDDVATNVARFFMLARPDARTSLWLDYENNPRHDMSMAMALEFLDRGDQILGRRIGIYGGDRIKRFVPGLRDAQRDFLGAHPLWGCEYGPAWKNVDVNGHPLPWAKPDLWQFTGDGIGPGPHTVDGLEHGADLSRFDGDRAALAAWWPLPALPAAPVMS